MNFISGFAEKLGLAKKPEAPVVPPTVSLEEKKQDAANLEAMMAKGRDFAHPDDARRLDELRTQIASQEAQQAPQVVTQPEVQPMGPTLVTSTPQEIPTPVQQPAAEEQQKVA